MYKYSLISAFDKHLNFEKVEFFLKFSIQLQILEIKLSNDSNELSFECFLGKDTGQLEKKIQQLHPYFFWHILKELDTLINSHSNVIVKAAPGFLDLVRMLIVYSGLWESKNIIREIKRLRHVSTGLSDASSMKAKTIKTIPPNKMNFRFSNDVVYELRVKN
ncbi:hypothetical protein BpHYR1_037401 [Brachionus plicatilis]|uniref:Uncharacterized protein n=1 Tax=Brachionus plicatilis TaxID=10195 RepID=A0A3M7SQ81_BRAPC|nr:hypothetical protein BpHYR1_037401 [Brachionus plicatilis]